MRGRGAFRSSLGSFVLQNVIPCVVRIEFRLYALGIRQVVRHWVLVPAFGVRIPHPQPEKNTSAFAGVFSVMILNRHWRTLVRCRGGAKMSWFCLEVEISCFRKISLRVG